MSQLTLKTVRFQNLGGGGKTLIYSKIRVLNVTTQFNPDFKTFEITPQTIGALYVSVINRKNKNRICSGYPLKNFILGH